MSSGKHRPRLPAHQKHFADGAAENLSDLAAGQSHVAVQNDGNALVVSEHLKVGNDARRSRPSRGSVDDSTRSRSSQGKLTGARAALHHRPERLDPRIRHSVPAPVELARTSWTTRSVYRWITRQEVGRGLEKADVPRSATAAYSSSRTAGMLHLFDVHCSCNHEGASQHLSSS